MEHRFTAQDAKNNYNPIKGILESIERDFL